MIGVALALHVKRLVGKSSRMARARAVQAFQHFADAKGYAALGVLTMPITFRFSVPKE
ncbi:hypothetical protein [Paraburkholderia kirstenboschensis]|uniref:Uncharacterized protein n=1 Tax=Paraburkholderia kirstenboschensis TaxID=1245436 RepID=A0ABZ0ECW5_9BURK|nr:hypothetical protein [Paraburkholderia kirstenboschensis]WOD14087.1 hypothetical protein RW095_00755 [Paraburkholderia kirstenboschensis]